MPTLKPFFLLLACYLLCAQSLHAQKRYKPDSTNIFPKHAIVTTPLMSLIGDSKPSFYYRLYLDKVNDESKVFAMRLGTELLSSAENRFGSITIDEFRAFNLKVGLERGKRFGRSVIYAGVEYSYSRYVTNGAILYPEAGALFNLNNLVTQSSGREESKLGINSFIGFVGFKYNLSRHFEVGIESAFGYGWYENEVYEGNISQFTPNRFIFLGYNF